MMCSLILMLCSDVDRCNLCKYEHHWHHCFCTDTARCISVVYSHHITVLQTPPLPMYNLDVVLDDEWSRCGFLDVISTFSTSVLTREMIGLIIIISASCEETAASGAAQQLVGITRMCR